MQFDEIGYALRVLHLLAAILMAGGIFYIGLVLIPALRRLPPETADEVRAAVRARWAMLIGIAALVLIATGMYNYLANVRGWQMPKYYHMVFGIKFLLALIVFFLASLLAGRTGLAEKMRAKAGGMTQVLIVLVLVIVALAAVMRMAHNAREPKPEPAAAALRPTIQASNAASQVGRL